MQIDDLYFILHAAAHPILIRVVYFRVITCTYQLCIQQNLENIVIQGKRFETSMKNPQSCKKQVYTLKYHPEIV